MGSHETGKHDNVFLMDSQSRHWVGFQSINRIYSPHTSHNIRQEDQHCLHFRWDRHDNVCNLCWWHFWYDFWSFLPRCMKCRRGLGMRILSVRPSVRLTRGLWQNEIKISRDFYTIRKIIYPSFLRKRIVGRGRPILSKIFDQPTPVGAKSTILNW